MSGFLTVTLRILAVIVCFIPAAVWHWMTGRGYSRRQTFFGARVQPGFAESAAGQAILKQFRLRIWTWSAAGAAVSALAPLLYGDVVGATIASLAGMAGFALANRRTKREVEAVAGPAIRVASLVAGSEAEAWWLDALDWLAMLVPPAVPAATLMVLALHWSQVPAASRGAATLLPVCFGLILGLMCTAIQWALRFRARSSDWAPTPGASHKYRTYLGAMNAFVFGFIVCQLCAVQLIELSASVAFLPRFAMHTYFLATFPAQGLWVAGIWRMRFWLARHLATGSGDPMPDTCWKWGCVYFNPSDPVLVVPLRTGVGLSYNCARPTVWMVATAVTGLTIASLVQSFGLLAQAGRHFPN